jgi:tetratricopeptide (TPR) repeat protein
MKNYPLAEQYIKQAIGVNPDLPDNYLTLGDVYRQQGDLKAAVAAYEDALARKPGWQAAIDRLTAVQAELQKKSH